MKADIGLIGTKGVLFVSPETKLEQYALVKWLDDNQWAEDRTPEKLQENGLENINISCELPTEER